MPRFLIVAALMLIAAHVVAQRDTSRGFLPKQRIDSSRTIDTTKIKLNLGKWDDVPLESPNGVLFRFDYTKLLEWLLPKKKPVIPPECDPMFMRDWIPDTTKPDSTKIDMP